MTTIGILGAGKVGTALARRAVAAGYHTLISASGDPAAIQLIVDVAAPGAITMTSADVAHEADVVILAVPLGKYRTLPVAQLAGKTVIDAMNYWPPTDGAIEEFEGGTSSSTIVARYLSASRVVKAFSHLGYHQLDEDSRPAAAPDRSAIAVAGDDDESVAVVARIVDRFGFDPVIAGALEDGARFGPGSEPFGLSTDRSQLERLLATAGGLDRSQLSAAAA